MAIYKPTNCTPFLGTFDSKVTSVDEALFLECRVDSSNRNAVAYSVMVYDEYNNQVFPPNNMYADENMSKTANLQWYTGNGYYEGLEYYLIQSSGYTNLNTGLNGSYLKLPFILPLSSYPGESDTATANEEEQEVFWSLNTIYYDSDNGVLVWFASASDASPVEIDMQNGNSYKWTITLYQGDANGNAPPEHSETAYKYYDMQLTTGQVMGSYDERIQTAYSDLVYTDYYLQPIYIPGLSFQPDDPINWTAGEENLGNIQFVGTRARIKNIDSTYGYYYPQMDEYSYSSGTIVKASSGTYANAYQVFEMSNDPSVLATTRTVDQCIEGITVPFDWYNMASNSATSYGQLTFYVLKSDSSATVSGVTLQPYSSTGGMSSSSFNPFGLRSLSSTLDGTESNRWFYTSGAASAISTSSRVLLNSQPPSSAYNGDVDAAERICNLNNGSTNTTTIYSTSNYTNSPYNGIYSVRFSGGTVVSITVGGSAHDFYEYTLTFDRTSDADTWGELSTKIVAVLGGDLAGENKQCAYDEDNDDSTTYVINQTDLHFGDEQPITLFDGDEVASSDTEGLEAARRTAGVIFYNDAEVKKGNILYIRPFVGIQRGMYWIEEGNMSDLSRRRFIIDSVNTDYWYVTYAGEYSASESVGTYPSSFTEAPERDTRYVIKSFFKESDENPFDLYDAPTIALKVYRDEEYNYTASVTTPDGLFDGSEGAGQTYFDSDGQYICFEYYGLESDISLLRVDRRSIWVEADYDQADYISWQSAQWFLYSGLGTSGELVQSSDVIYDGKLGYQFYGLVQNQMYTIMLVLQTNTGLVCSTSLYIITDFATATVENFPFHAEFDCATQSVYLEFGLSGFVLPNLLLTQEEIIQRLGDYRFQAHSLDDTRPAIPRTRYGWGTDTADAMVVDFHPHYENYRVIYDGSANSDGEVIQTWEGNDYENLTVPESTTPGEESEGGDFAVRQGGITFVLDPEDFPEEGITYEYVCSTLDPDTMSIDTLTTDEDSVCIESSHILKATDTWGNIMGVDFSDNESLEGQFQSVNAFQLYLPEYLFTEEFAGEEITYPNVALMYSMRYQLGNGVFSNISIYDAETGDLISSAGIWGAQLDEGGTTATTTPFPIIISPWHGPGFSQEDNDVIAPENYKGIYVKGDDDTFYFSPSSEVVNDASKTLYRETGFDLLSKEGEEGATGEDLPDDVPDLMINSEEYKSHARYYEFGVLPSEYSVTVALKDGTSNIIYDGNPKTPALKITIKSLCKALDENGEEIVDRELTIEIETDVESDYDEAYSVIYENNTDAGTATATVTLYLNFAGGPSDFITLEPLEFTIDPIDASTSGDDFEVTLSEYSYEWDGDAKTPGVTVTYQDEELVADEDYEIAYRDNVEPGTATVEITLQGNYTGTLEAQFTINRVVVDIPIYTSSFEYDGTTHTAITLTDEQAAIIELGGDFSATEAGTYEFTLTIDSGHYVWSDGTDAQITCTWQITAADVTDAEVTLSDTSYVWDGNAKTPGVTVTVQGTVLVEGEDYTYTYSNNIEPGTATVTVTLTGNYTGTIVVTFTITKITVERPEVATTVFTNDGTAHTVVEVASGMEDIYSISGTATATEGGYYTATVSLTDPDHYQWDSGSSSSYVIAWVILDTGYEDYYVSSTAEDADYEEDGAYGEFLEVPETEGGSTTEIFRSAEFATTSYSFSRPVTLNFTRGDRPVIFATTEDDNETFGGQGEFFYARLDSQDGETHDNSFDVGLEDDSLVWTAWNHEENGYKYINSQKFVYADMATKTSLWSDYTLERKTLGISGTVSYTFDPSAVLVNDADMVPTIDITKTITREVENLDEAWTWPSGDDEDTLYWVDEGEYRINPGSSADDPTYIQPSTELVAQTQYVYASNGAFDDGTGGLGTRSDLSNYKFYVRANIENLATILSATASVDIWQEKVEIDYDQGILDELVPDDEDDDEDNDEGDDGSGDEGGDDDEDTPPVEQTKLASPVISISGNVVSWAAVENANSYDVLIDGSVAATVATTSYTLNIEDEGSYAITVIAKNSNDSNYLDSDPSNSVTYTVVAEITQLAAPQISISGSTVSWSAVAHADTYSVLVNESVVTSGVTSTSYTIVIGAAGSYSITVTAHSNSDSYTDSEPSNVVTYTKTEGAAVWHDATDSNGNFVEITSDQIPDDVIFEGGVTRNIAVRISDIYDTELNEEHSSFNCYRWAIGYYGALHDGSTIASASPGSIYDTSVSVRNGTRALANATLQDLLCETLNKQNVRWATGIPDVDDLADGEHLIAFRVSYHMDGYINDFHFMKYDPDDGSYNGWTHKPGGSYILKIKSGYSPWSAVDFNGVNAWLVENAITDIEDGDAYSLMGGPDGSGTGSAGTMLILGAYAYLGQIVYIRYTDD